MQEFLIAAKSPFVHLTSLCVTCNGGYATSIVISVVDEEMKKKYCDL